MLGKNTDLPEHLSAKSGRCPARGQLQFGVEGCFSKHLERALEVFTDIFPGVTSVKYRDIFLPSLYLSFILRAHIFFYFVLQMFSGRQKSVNCSQLSFMLLRILVVANLFYSFMLTF